jgi:hypothetical protein
VHLLETFIRNLIEDARYRKPQEYNNVSPSVKVDNKTGFMQPSVKKKGKRKAFLLQALTNPKGFKRLKLPDFKTVDT